MPRLDSGRLDQCPWLGSGPGDGQSLPEDPGVAAWLWGSSWPALSDEVRNEHPSIFAPEIPIAAERPTLDRLLGFLGRDPNWVGPA
ncbi:MAG: hypothetical protein ABSC35_01380 [Candidatus Dormibacteria bacterium]